MATGTTNAVPAVMRLLETPQWSPVVTTGTTPDGSRVLLAHSCEPQWSPVVTTGTTFSSWAAACDYEKGRNGAPS